MSMFVGGSAKAAMFEAFRLKQGLAKGGGAPAAAASSGLPSSKRKRHGGGDASTKDRRLAGAGRGGNAAAAAAAGAAAVAAVPATSPQHGQQQGGLALEKMGDAPLRLVIVGHNPSEHAWSSGHFYSNPSNWLWRILRETGIAPAAAIRGAVDDGKMPALAGVGFTDVGSGTPGTDSAQFSSHDFAHWRPAFYSRLAAQAQRASSIVEGCTCGTCGAPSIVAFSGKRQFSELFLQAAGKGRGKGRGAGRGGRGGGGEQGPAGAALMGAEAGSEARQAQSKDVGASSSSNEQASPAGDDRQLARLPTVQAWRPSSIGTGRQWVLPDGWPLPLSTEVWVMTSTSGAAPMTRQQRFAPWQTLAERLQREPWPRQCVVRCSGSSRKSAAVPVPAEAAPAGVAGAGQA